MYKYLIINFEICLKRYEFLFLNQYFSALLFVQFGH